MTAPYRSDLDAALARVADLEAEVRRLRVLLLARDTGRLSRTIARWAAAMTPRRMRDQIAPDVLSFLVWAIVGGIATAVVVSWWP